MNNKTLIIGLLTAGMFAGGCGSATQSAQNSSTPSTGSTPANSAKPATTATPAQVASDLKPSDVTPDKPVPAAELSAAFKADQEAWKGKVVSITGNYNSHTTSTVSSGKVIRIDISDSSGKKVAACQVAVEPTKEEVAQRNNRTFKGTVKDSWFGQVLLEPCEMMK